MSYNRLTRYCLRLTSYNTKRWSLNRKRPDRENSAREDDSFLETLQRNIIIIIIIIISILSSARKPSERLSFIIIYIFYANSRRVYTCVLNYDITLMRCGYVLRRSIYEKLVLLHYIICYDRYRRVILHIIILLYVRCVYFESPKWKNHRQKRLVCPRHRWRRSIFLTYIII